MEPSNFDVGFQRSLLRLVMLDDAFCHRVMKYMEVSFFTTEVLGWIFKFFKAYYEAYNGPCTAMALENSTTHMPKEEAAVYQQEIRKLLDIRAVAEEGFIKDRLQEFIRRNMFVQLFHDTQDLYNSTQSVNRSVDLLMQTTEAIQQVTFEAPDRSWFFEEFNKRNYRRIQDGRDPTSNTITSGLPAYDDIIGGGISLGELMIMLGLAKVGKTTWLINMGFASTRIARVPTLHCNYEGSIEIVQNRYDTCFSQALYTDVKYGNLDTKTIQILLEEYQYLKKLLVIRSFTKNWDNNATTITGELAELKAVGFKPKLIIVDYADLLRSRHRVDSETKHQTDAMKDLKQIANRGYAIWTACQGRRPKGSMQENPTYLLRSSEIADAYAKIRIADGYGSLNATREEKAANVSRLFWEDYREQPVGRLFRLYNKNDRMLLGDEIKEIRFDEQSQFVA